MGSSFAQSLNAEQVVAHSDSQLVVNQILSLYGAKGELTTRNLFKAMEVIAKLPAVQINRIPRVENARADALAWLASATRVELRRTIPIEILANRSINEDLMINFIALDMGPS